MKKSKIAKWSAAAGIGLAFLLALAIPMGGGALTDKNKGGDIASSDIITASAAGTVASSYDKLQDGSSYYYTDASLINAFRGGTGTTDTLSTEVDTSEQHGSAKNPFVINTIDQWTKFAGDSAADDSSKVFVLGSDIDFLSTQGKFTPVPSLSAKFYGTNHKLKNIKHDFANAGTCGVFCTVAKDAVVADVSLDNVDISGILVDAAGEFGGTLIGDNQGANVLNCHAKGTIAGKHSYYGNSTTVDLYASIGGLIGGIRGAEVYVYRCSVDVKMDMTSTSVFAAGGMVGSVNAKNTTLTTLRMYDCFTIVYFNLLSSSSDTYFGGLVCFPYQRYAVTKAFFDNCAVYMYTQYNYTGNMIDAPILSGYGNTITTTRAEINLSNIYSDGKRKTASATALNGTYGATWYYETPSSGSDTNSVTLTGSGNINWYGITTAASGGYTACPGELFSIKGVATNRYDGSAGKERADFWDKLKTDNNFSTRIWVNKSVVDEAYMTNTDVTSTAGYTIDNSPVRNPLVVRVSYYDYVDGKDEPIEIDGVTQPVIKKAGESLDVPSPDGYTNRTFVGWVTDKDWTPDKMGTSEAPFTSMPASLLGDNKLYAVWQAKQSSAEITAKLGRSNTAITYDATDGFVGTYDGTGIVLTANLTVGGMTDAQVSYQWTRNGEDIGEEGTLKDYTVKYVNDTRTEYDDYCNFGVKLNYTSKSEPLFFGSAIGSARKVTMNPVDKDDISFENVRIKSGQHAYIGAYTGSVDILGSVYYGTNVELKGTLAWDNLIARFGSDEDKVADNKETRTVYFIPDESYGGNYGESISYEFTFPIETLKFTFNLTGFTDPSMKTVRVDLVYGDNYSYSKIADLFEEAMATNMDKLGGNAPIFKLLDNKEYKIADFRKENKTFEAVSDPAVLQITVRFEAQSHNVTFDANGGTLEDGAELNPQTVRYGNHASVPNVKMTNGSLLFLGWFYETKDDDGNPVEKQWDFDNDCVTQDLSFKAVWLAANTLVKITAEVVPGAVFPANAAMDKSKLIVKATYSGTRDDKSIEQTVVLDSSQYTLKYYNSNGAQFSGDALHVTDDGSDTKVVVEYVNPGSILVTGDKDKTEIFVKPQKIKLNTQEIIESGIYGDITVEMNKDGSAVSHPIEDPGQIADLFSQINTSNITYTYSSGGREVDPNDVNEPIEYTVTAHFTTRNPDYEAPDISVMLRIVREKTTLSVKWDATKFTFNNKVQVPTPTFWTTNADGTEKEVKNVKYHLSGDNEVTSVGSNYYVDLVLDETAYRLDGFVGTAFEIEKAKVKVPTQAEALDYIGAEYDLNALADEYKYFFNDLDTDLVTVTTNATGTNAGSYIAYIVLKDAVNSEWDGVTGVRQSMTWKINPAQLSVFWGNDNRFAVNANVPSVVYFVGLMEGDMDAAQLSDLSYVGDSDMSQMGSHTLTVSLKSSAAWAKNYQLDDSKSFTFVVADGEGDVIMVYIDWGDTNFVYQENNWQGPSYTLRLQEDGSDVTEMLKNMNAVTVESGTALWAGSYEMKVSLDSKSGYYLYGKTTCNYSISRDSAGNGGDPNATPEGGGGGSNPNPNTSNIPLWQVIVSAACILLFVICAAKSYGNFGKAKAAKREAKELAMQSYVSNYAFAPLPLLLAVGGKSLWGMGETPWTIIACVAIGLFVISLAMLFISSKKRSAAELSLKREQARIAEEKELAREEEQQRREEEQLRREEQMREEQRRRDEEMKMMFAAMQQGYQQPQMNYGDMQNMIASTISALLPAVQQQMALPPAQDQSAYAQNNYAQNDYARREADELRAQLAEQKALINQLLQNQQAQQTYDYEEPEDDTSWLGENDEMVSLEESYGALNDDGRRAYYDIGSYIMSKPYTSQNDGRYAVLFKYRGRTIFKLAIKDDAPVLYYPAGNGASAQVRVDGAPSLEIAKGVIDRTVAMTDSQLN